MSAAALLQARLEGDDLAALWRDLSVLARIEGVQMEDAHGTRPCRLEDVFAGLERGATRRALIRYRFEDQVWSDTLTVAEDGGVHLVRIADPEAGTSPD